MASRTAGLWPTGEPPTTGGRREALQEFWSETSLWEQAADSCSRDPQDDGNKAPDAAGTDRTEKDAGQCPSASPQLQGASSW